MSENYTTVNNHWNDIRPTPSLRYVVRNGKKVLQQAFLETGPYVHNLVWKDVPTEEQV